MLLLVPYLAYLHNFLQQFLLLKPEASDSRHMLTHIFAYSEMWSRGLSRVISHARACWESNKIMSVSSHQVIGMFPGMDGQAPFVTCAAKVIVVDNLPHSSATCHPGVIPLPLTSIWWKSHFWGTPPCPLHHLSVFIFSFPPPFCCINLSSEIQSWQRWMGKKRAGMAFP